MNKKVINELLDTGVWGEMDAEMGVESDFKCEYCGKDLLLSVDAYKEWQTDHLIPSSSGGEDCKSNDVISCRTCNFIKGRWNPLGDDDSCSRDEMINRAKNYINRKRSQNEKLLVRFREIAGRSK